MTRPAISTALLTLLLGGLGCNEIEFLAPSATFRGITIPLPPPSFADEGEITIDIEGTVPIGFEGPGAQALVYEKATERGYFTFTDTNEYTIEDVLVQIDDNCLELWVVSGEGEQSTDTNYKVVLREGEEACSDTTCSAPDDLGACVCLEKWTLGC